MALTFPLLRTPARTVGLDGLRALAAGFADATDAGDLLDLLDLTCDGDDLADDRTSVRLLATDAYEAWLSRWAPGSSVTPHDHGDSNGVVQVLSGELTEVQWRNGLRAIRTIGAGARIDVGAGVVHDMVAFGDRPAASLHVYSPPLTSMGFYDAGGRSLVRVEVIEPEPPVLTDDVRARVLHPSSA